MVPKIKSHVKDTNDFINKIESQKKLPENAIIGTLDVTALYTNIPNDEGLRTILKKLVDTRGPNVQPKNQSLVDLAELVLTRNNIEFNGKHYHQISGTAMGTKLAPSYANLFMEKLEEDLLSKSQYKPKYGFDILMTFSSCGHMVKTN